MLDRGYVQATSPVHALSAPAKIIAVVTFVLIVVLTPREWVPAFVGYALIVAVAAAVSRIPLKRLAAGLAIEIPFVAFALLLPVIHPGGEGLWAAWNILVKATLGVMAATLLAATTTPVALVAGLQTLRLPAPVVAIFTFFIRYVDVVADEYTRMRIAQRARGMNATSPRSWPALAACMGSLFVRSYERGERVHLALLSRGYNGRLPIEQPDDVRVWPAAALPVSAALVLLASAAVRW